MGEFKAIKVHPNAANVEPLAAVRDWMDETAERHAYMCFPLSISNRLGWGISFPEDISFIWDGITDTTSDHIKILRGHKYATTGRGNATVSFSTGLIFKTDESTTEKKVTTKKATTKKSTSPKKATSKNKEEK